MGQTMGKMPETWEGLMEEKDRVLYWSSEVLAKVQDNIRNEDTFLMDYDEEKMDGKIDTWIKTNQIHVDEILNKFPNATTEIKDIIKNGIEKLTEEIKAKMRKDYQCAYNDIKKFSKKIDELDVNEKKIHADIQKLEQESERDVQKFQKQFGPLRIKVFDNLKAGEKMIFQEKKLKGDFTKKIYDIDHKNSAECTKRIEKLLKDFEKSAAKQTT